LGAALVLWANGLTRWSIDRPSDLDAGKAIRFLAAYEAARRGLWFFCEKVEAN